MVHEVMNTVAKTICGIAAAIRARPKVFAGVAVGVLALDVFLPLLILSVVRKPVDYFTFNPWLKKLPEYLASSQVSVQRKLEFLPNFALFWFSADSPFGVEWGFSVSVSDLARFVFMSLIIGAYFALWLYRRDQLASCGWSANASRRGGVAGAFASVLGLSTGPCGVVGCGAPVVPVVGLAFVGLSSGTLKWLAELSRIATAVVLLAMALGVVYAGWRVSATPGERR